MCKHWGLGCVNKNSLTSGKPSLENGKLIYISIYHVYSNNKKHTDTYMNKGYRYQYIYISTSIELIINFLNYM